MSKSPFCTRCQETDPSKFYSHEYSRCKKCHNKDMVIYVSRRRRKIKEMAVAYKGGKCERCGYSKSINALSFHHRDPTQKEFNLAKGGHTRSWERVKLELDKCVLLCANCHAENHEETDSDRVKTYEREVLPRRFPTPS